MSPTPDSNLVAQEVEGHLRAIRQVLRQPMPAEFARGPLTGPQRSVMQVLYHAEGLSLKELSRRMALAHSTVSGIVDRLEKRGVVERRPDVFDGRVSVIHVAPPVRESLRDAYPGVVLHPISAAMGRATLAESGAILEGLRTLHRLVEETSVRNPQTE
jgi:DNA-binding MarR family transcriptional regulator